MVRYTKVVSIRRKHGKKTYFSYLTTVPQTIRKYLGGLTKDDTIIWEENRKTGKIEVTKEK